MAGSKVNDTVGTGNMYLKKAWYHKTYIDTNSSIDFETLHQKNN